MTDKKNNLKLDKFSKGNTYISFLKFSLPVIVMIFTFQAYSFFDALFIGEYVNYSVPGINGTTALAAVTPITMVCWAVVSLITIGFGSKFSNALGENDEIKIKKALSTGYINSIVALFIMVIFMFAITYPMIEAIFNKAQIMLDAAGKGENIINDTTFYIMINVVIFFSIGISEMVIKELVSEGHIWSSIVPLISFPINLLLDWIFMDPRFGIDMGIIGSALATLVAEISIYPLLFVFLFLYKRKDETYFSLKILTYGYDKDLSKKMLKTGFAPFVLSISAGITQFIATIVIANYADPEWTTWMSAANIIVYLILCAAFGAGSAGVSYIGYNYGAKNAKRTKESIYAMFIWSFVIMIILFFIIIILTGPLLSALGISVKKGIDVTVFKEMKIALVFWLFSSVLTATFNRISEYSTAVNKSSFGVKVMLISSFLVYLPILFIWWLIIYLTNLPSFYIVYYLIIYGVLNLIIICPVAMFFMNKKIKEMEKGVFN